MSNKSQKLVLADAFGNTIDSVQYADASPWPSSADGTGPYLQLIDVSLDNSLASSWEASSTSLAVGEYNYVTNTTFFPNPVSSILNVQSEFMLTKIEIFDYNGRLLKQLIPNSETTQINVSDLQNGLYFVKAYNNEATKTEKFFKK